MQQVGGDLLANQWDSLLLECGFTSVLVAPISYSGPPVMTGKDRMTFWLVRWTLFRLYFTTEVIKFNTKSPSWWKLSGTNTNTQQFYKYLSTIYNSLQHSRTTMKHRAFLPH